MSELIVWKCDECLNVFQYELHIVTIRQRANVESSNGTLTGFWRNAEVAVCDRCFIRYRGTTRDRA